jgi:acyl-CoA reductase-like NAD-dependent aldehyde dehydrogenase
MTDISMFIDGERRAATGGATFERRNPLDGSVATRAPAGTPADAVPPSRPRSAPSPSGRRRAPAHAARCC